MFNPSVRTRHVTEVRDTTLDHVTFAAWPPHSGEAVMSTELMIREFWGHSKRMVGAKEPKPEGPIRITRRLLASVRSLGVISITYYYRQLYKSSDNFNLYLNFSGDKKAHRYNIPEEQHESLCKCHDYVIDNGKVLILSNALPLFRSVEPELTDAVMRGANALGVQDQYMIPVYGPFNMNGVISLGFSKIIDPRDRDTARRLTEIALAYHYEMVQHFGEKRSDVDLSKRENEVLTWIARGKSNTDIATILGISISSVDTYTRRIFEKMGVNDRVSAAMSGVAEGLIKPR